MIGRERGWPAEKLLIASGGIAIFVRRGNFGEFFEARVFEKIAQVAE